MGGDRGLVEAIAQQVFANLARKAASADALEVRAVVFAGIAASPATAPRCGHPLQLLPASGRVTVTPGNGDLQLTKGINLYRVKGRAASETIRVY